MSLEERQKIKLIDIEQKKAGRLLGGDAGRRLEEAVQVREPLSRRHAENLSLYSPQEELEGLEKISSDLNFPVAIVPIGDGEDNLGYMVVPKFKGGSRRSIIIEAAIDFVDYDDTQAQTSTKKHECWSELEKLGISMVIVKYCDRIARLSFQKEQGEIYEPELDMRLLTYALEHPNSDEAQLKQELDSYLQSILDSTESATKVFGRLSTNPKIKGIFDKTRFTVALYPDTEEILTSLQGGYEEGSTSNVFVLTFGDTLFQLQKALPLLKDGAVQAIFLTKAKKGPFIEQLFLQDPFKHSGKTEALWHYVDHRHTHNLGRGFDPEGEFPMALTDDDPSQVSSVNELGEKLGFMIEARRLVSPDQKRAEAPTPQGKRVVELHRDEQLRIKEDMKKIQAELYFRAVFSFLVHRFREWVRGYRINYGVYKLDKKYPYVNEFLTTFYGKKLVQAARYQMQADGSTDESATVQKLKDEFMLIATNIVDEQITIQDS